MPGQIPVIKVYDKLLVSVQIQMSDHLVQELKEDITTAIEKHNPRGLMIEVSGVDILDSYIARSIRDIAQISKLMGVSTVVAGIDPSMAMTLVEMGMMLDGVSTCLSLEDAIDFLDDIHSQKKQNLEDNMQAVLASILDADLQDQGKSS